MTDSLSTALIRVGGLAPLKSSIELESIAIMESMMNGPP